MFFWFSIFFCGSLRHGILYYFVACKHLVYFVFFCKVSSFSRSRLFLIFFAVVVLLADGFESQINRFRKSLNPSRPY